MIDFKCPYNDLGCIYLDTAGMFKSVECYDCENYNNGIKAEEEQPPEDEEMEDHNRFMMGL